MLWSDIDSTFRGYCVPRRFGARKDSNLKQKVKTWLSWSQTCHDTCYLKKLKGAKKCFVSWEQGNAAEG